MTPNTGNLAPYAPLANVVGLIRRTREKGLPEILNADKLTQLGIPDGNISRTLQALRFLNLIDEEGRQLLPFNRLATAKENEYSSVLADIIRSAYHDAFAIIGNNPNDVSDRELVDAFRVYQPETQRNRMIILFRGLCQEAGLIAGGPPETRTRTRTSNKPSTFSRANGQRKPPEPKDEHQSQQETDQATSQPSSHSATNQDFVLVRGLISTLPSDKQWTQQDREKWLNAVTAMVDLLIKVVDPTPGDVSYTR